MNARIDNWETGRLHGSAPGLVFRQAHWGVKIANVTSHKHAIAAEFFIKAIGLTIVLLAIVALASTTNYGSLYTIGTTAPPALLSAFGLGLYCYAAKGLISEVHIDESRREIRLGTRNASGRLYSLRTMSLRDIQSIFIRRKSGPDSSVSLQVHMKNSDSAITLLRGQESELVALMEYIADLSSEKGKRRPRTKTTGRFIRADFSSR